MQLVNFFAYLDPGTGSLIIQSLIGAAAGVAVFGRSTIIKLKQKFKGSKPADPAAAAKNANNDTVKKSDDTTK